MARRDRVPRHKSHNHKRNKNAKLSPFQREQKRAKLANQVPTVRTIGGLDSIPHSQRHVFNYLQQKKERQQEKRAALELARAHRSDAPPVAEASPTGSSTPDPSTRRKATSSRNVGEPAAADDAACRTPAATTSTANSSKKKATEYSSKKKATEYPSLNEELTASVGAALQPIMLRSREGASAAAASADPNAPRSVDEIIARKKERKHRRNQEARRARIAAELEDMETELQDYVKGVNSAGAKGRAKRGKNGERPTERDRINVTFERQLKLMAKTENTEKADDNVGARKRHRAADFTGGDNDTASHRGADGRHDADDNNNAAENPPRQRRRISFDPEVADPAAGQLTRRAAKNKKPKDFYELVDVVRYGERVEAPPVFDVVPNRNAAVTRLAHQLEEDASGRRARRSGADERHRLLAGGGQLGEQKRLARLGLAPAITHTVRADASAATASAARMSKEEEIKALRDRVMATYQRNRRKEVVERKGVDMRHNFPTFA